jgi:hypothetical protein
MSLKISVAHENRATPTTTYPDALALGYPVAVVGAALKASALLAVRDVADAYRAQLAQASAGKLAAYRIKEEIARDPAAADPAELALIDREAVACGLDRAGLLALIAAKAAAYRQIALLIEALEAETGAAIAAIADDAADIEVQVQTVLDAAIAEAETAYVDAVALLTV